MKPEKTVTLNAEEAEVIYDLLDRALRDSGHKEPDEADRREWRLFVKLDKLVGSQYHPMSLLDDLPPWLRVIFHKTFAPEPVPPKPKAAAAKPKPKPRPKPRKKTPKRTLPLATETLPQVAGPAE